MKRLLAGALSICFVFWLLPQILVLASENEEVVVVGYQPNLELVEDINSMYHKGYGYDVLKKVEEISNLKFEFKEIKGDMFEAIRTGEVDISGLYFGTDERRKEFLYLDTPFSEQHMCLAVKEEVLSAGDVVYGDNDYIEGKTIATYEGNAANDLLVEYCAKNLMGQPKFMYGDLSTYLSQDADLYLTYTGNVNSEEFNTVLNLDIYHTYIISSYENSDLMDKINDAVMTIVRTEGNFFAELEEKYISDKISLNHRTLTQEEHDVLQSKTLNVGYLEYYRPMTYTDENGEASGALVNSLKLLAQMYDIDLVFEPYLLEDQDLVYDKFDIIITMYGSNQSMFENFQQTESYLDVSMSAFLNKQLSDQYPNIEDSFEHAKNVGMLEYLFVNYDKLEERTVNGDVVLYPNIDVMLDDYKNGILDIAIFTETAAAYAGTYIDNDNQEANRIELDIPISFLISNEIAKEYIPIFNVMIDNVREDEFENLLINESTLFLPEINIIDEIVDYWYYVVIVILLIGGAIITFYVKQQSQKNEEIKRAYNTDILTNFPSFANFRETATKVLHNAKANEYELISFDIDLFKLINTYYGMVKGTSIIVGISSALKEVFEGSNALICRRTSDQFIVLRKVDDKGDIKNIYKRNILPAMRNVIGDNYNISMSFGSMVISEPEQKISEIIAYADEARLRGKDQHGNTFNTFTPQMLKQYNNRINITLRMEKALEDREFVPYFQPKIDFKTLEVNGAEALVRWIPKVGNIIYPGDFIEIFEQNGFIRQLDMYMFEEVCKFITENRGKMKMPIISTNLSAITVLHKKTIDNMLSILIKYKLNTKDIELEVTESAIIGSEDEFLLQVKRMNAAGFIVSIDDFGAGVSSLNRLSAIEADVIKLDKAFFDLKDQGGRSTIVVEDVINMAKRLEMKIVAEGVETYAQALWLKGLECDLAQGYYFAKPMDADSFKEILIEDRIYDLKNKSTLID